MAFFLPFLTPYYSHLQSSKGNLNVNIQSTPVEWAVRKGGALPAIQGLTDHLLGLLLKKWTLASQECLERAQMKDYIIMSGLRKFCEIRPENKALKLIWSCRHDEDSAEILGKPAKKSRIWETLTLSVCADSRTKINPIWHIFLPF